MKQILTYIFSLIVISAAGQLSDDFSDGDFTNSPSWSGTTGNFMVNAGLQLQLNAAAAGESYLSLPANYVFNGNAEWKFYIKQDFAPSSSNYGRIYLSSDKSDLSQPLNGYYIQFGEALSNDAIELFRQDGAISTSVCRATNGRISGPFEARLRILRDSLFNWKLFVDYSGGVNYLSEASGNDSLYRSPAYMGMKCVYTSGNIARFFFDDIYYGPEIMDTIPPEIISADVLNDSMIAVTFSEAVDTTSVTALNNYSVDNGIGNPVAVFPDSARQYTYRLKFTNHFQGLLSNNLSVSGIRDVSQNEIIPEVFPIVFVPVAPVQVNDIVISEVYFAPSTAGPLPYAEYVEIYNRNDSAVELKDWILSDETTDGNIPAFRLGPGEYALLVHCDDASLFTAYSNVYCLNSFPSLNNDGDHIKLIDSNGAVIDELWFDAETYGDHSKDDGGWSIERVDAGFICMNSGNWRASVSSLHGTPSSANSVKGVFADDDAPYITNVYLKDSLTLIIQFSEEVSDEANDISNYKITLQDESQLISLQSASLFEDSAVVTFSSLVPGGLHTLQVSERVHDCPGNPIHTFRTKKFGYAETASQEDIIVNEILFYSFDGGNDFVELYNRSGKIIDLKDWLINETDQTFTEIRESAKICPDHKLIFPGDYMLLSEDGKKVKSFYHSKDDYCFMDVKSMPDFSSDDGGVILSNSFGEMISGFSYNDKMHFPLLKDKRGVSLERMNFTNDVNNWHSAAETAGFATPGYLNSQSIDDASGDGGFSLGSEIFSPDGDGYCDVLALHYRFEQTGSVLSLNVFDDEGRKVRSVLDHQTINTEGDLFWDGLSDKREELPAGMYIVLARSYDLKGNNLLYKRGVFLTRNTK